MKLVEEVARALRKWEGLYSSWDHSPANARKRYEQGATIMLQIFLAALRREPSLAATDKAALEIWTRFGVHENWQDVPEAERKTWRNAALACGSAMVAERVKEWGE